MRIFVLEVKNRTKCLIIAAIAVLLLIAAGMTRMGVVDVFSDGRQLPIYSVECSEKKVSLTFDCAWGANDIPEILDTLGKENIKATFFIVGQWAEKFPGAVKQISNEGHDIANHSYSHLRMGELDENKIGQEIALCDKKLNEISGVKVNLFRAPYGDYNNSVIATAKELGHYTIQWDVDSLDWKPGISQEEIYGRIMKKIKPGSILLFHNDTAHTAEMLPDIIKGLKAEGYSFLPVSSLILKKDYLIDFNGMQKSRE